MITKNGKNLLVIIFTETGKEWETFATWYSVSKNLPDAKVAIASKRNSETPFELFQWARRVNVPVMHHNPYDETDNNLNKFHFLNVVSDRLFEYNMIIDSLTMVMEPLSKEIISIFKEGSHLEENVWLLRGKQIKEHFNRYAIEKELIRKPQTLCPEAKERNESSCLLSYKKGCGKWIDTLKGCPLSNAAGLASTDMTLNEIKIIEMWKRMCSLYSTVR